MVILFGGGDGGGIIITANGIRRIPPYDPPILHALKGARHLAQAASRKGAVAGDLGGVATRVAAGALEQVQKSAGSFDRAGEIVFLDEDGGFVCGSVGKPPIPIPFPKSFTLEGSLAEHAVVGAEMAVA
jgi:hypothetical protein